MEACDFHQRSPPARGRNCKFLSFLPVSSWVLQLNGITSIRISSLLSFSYHFPSPERNCWPLYPGPSLGVLTQESDTYEPRILRLRACWARRPSGRSLKWIECTTSILRTLWRPSGSLTSISSSSRLVSSKGPTWWWSRDMASILRAGWTTLCFWSPTAIRSTDEPWSLLALLCKPCCVCANNRKFRFFMEYPVLGSLWDPIINNTITKTFVFCSILSLLFHFQWQVLTLVFPLVKWFSLSNSHGTM